MVCDCGAPSHCGKCACCANPRGNVEFRVFQANTCPGDHTFGRCDRDECDFITYPQMLGALIMPRPDE